ncbi:Cna B-type domain-containing protein [Fundicoccus ignavus]|uniref:Cna B-type domain-containing protein n=1 Tax=Fundicoccus ignavus TaxID=2664442 RepID=A0A844C039_9LACT|nr:Cna B-type domain-containing protein [Fundicoccus ignavus]MRJ47698.1 Cna B-type domain-containing protein [Fundicoccus ignavus]
MKTKISFTLKQKIEKSVTTFLVALLLLNSSSNLIFAQEEMESISSTETEVLVSEPPTEATTFLESTEPDINVEDSFEPVEIITESETTQLSSESLIEDTTESTTETTTVQLQTKDFSSYLSSIKSEQNNQVVSSVQDASQVKLTFDFYMVDAQEDIQRTQYEYQLPKGLLIESTFQGQVVANNNVIGQFKVSTNGIVSIEFLKEASQQRGNFSLVAKVSNDASGQIEKVQFGQLLTLNIELPKDIQEEESNTTTQAETSEIAEFENIATSTKDELTIEENSTIPQLDQEIILEDDLQDLSAYASDFETQSSLIGTQEDSSMIMQSDRMSIESDPSLLLMSALTTAGATDLTSKITSVVVTVNGQVRTTFNDGEMVNIAINYQLAPGDISVEQPVVQYQLPDSINIVASQAGKVFDGTTEVGTYTITQEGLIKITFNESSIQSGVGRDGSIRFSAQASVEEVGDGGKVQFPGNSQPIVIKAPVVDNTDIRTVKTGTINQSKNRIDYKIEVSSDQGTSDMVKIHDGFSWIHNIETLNYDKPSLEVIKINANGNPTTVNLSQTQLTWTDGQNPSFDLANLPKLNANEKYIVTYSANIKANSTGESFYVSNWAYSSSGSKTSGEGENFTWYKNVTKSGWYDQNTGLVTWNIMINQNRQDISGYNINDLIPGTIVGNVTLTNNSYWSETTIPVSGNTLNYTFPTNLTNEQKTSQYTISYQTKPTAGSTQETNVAKMTSPTGTTIQDDAIVGITKREKSLDKSFQSSSMSGNMMTNNWRTYIVLPEGTLTNIIYEDIIQNGHDASGTDLGPNTHFAYASELETDLKQNLVIQIDNNNQYRYNGAVQTALKNGTATNEVTIKVTYYDANGKVVASTDSTTKVQRYIVEVLPLNGFNLVARDLTISNYRTHTDISSVETNGSITSVNKAKYDGLVKEASTTYTKLPELVKEQRIGTSVSYDSNPTTVDLEESNGVLNYRLRLTTTAVKNGDLVITDTLPEGATLVSGSVIGRFYGNDNWMPTNNNNEFNFVDQQNPTYTLVGNQLTITIKNYRFDASLPTIAILYQLDLKNDPAWKDVQTTEKQYTNTAQWGSSTATHETDVHRTIEKLTKSGQQLDINGNPVQLNADGTLAAGVVPSNQIKYTVEINPQGLNLNAGSDYLTLTDKLSGGDSYHPILDLNTLNLYRYDATQPDHKGVLVSESNYSFKYNAETHQFEMTIPDSKGYILEYVYNIDSNYLNNTAISNNINLMGEWGSASQTTMKVSDSSATSSQRFIKIYKVDEDNYKKTLPGTEFKLEYYDKTINSWKVKTETVIVNSEGNILWNLSGLNKSIDSDVLYRLTETKPLVGYSLPIKPFYFIWVGSHEDQVKSKLDAGVTQAEISETDIKFFGYTGGITYVSNKYTRVSAKKSWEDSNGNPLVNPPSSVKVTLYQQKQQVDGYKVTVISQSSADWLSDANSSKVVGTVYVNNKTNSSLTIGFNNILYTSYTVNGVTKTISPDYSKQPTMTINLSAITGDTTIFINTSNDHISGVEFSGYDRAGTVFVDRVAIESQTLSSSNNWTYNWDGLSAKDNNGNPLYYTVQEEPITGFTTSYVNNSGIQSGTINIINSAIVPPKPVEYTLPSTGGIGTTTLYLIGGMLLVLATVISYYQKIRRKD